MKIVMTIMAVIVGLMSTALGSVFMFAPDLLMPKAQLLVEGNFGYSTIRGLIGGPALIAGLMVFGGVFLKKYEALHTSAIIFMSWAVGRTFSLILDGFDSSVFSNVIIAFVMMTIITICYKVLSKTKK